MSIPRNKDFSSYGVALCSLLFGDTKTADETARFLHRQDLWHSVLDVAVLWKVIPKLRQRVDSLDLTISSDQKQKLTKLSIASTARSMLIAHRGGTVLNEFIRAGIPAAAFKGVGLLGNLYQNPGERSVGDVDLLIDEHALLRACNALDELGFAPKVSVPLEEWLKHIENRIHPTHGYIVFEDDDGIEIDLHWHLGMDRSEIFSTTALLQRAEEIMLLGIPVKAVAPLDAMMLTVHHTIRDYFRPWSTVKDLCDLSAWWEVQPKRWRIRDAVEYSVDCGFSKSLLGLWMTLTDFDGGHPAVKGVKQFNDLVCEKDRSQALQIRDLFNLQLREGAMDQLLVGLLGFSLNSLKRFVAYETKEKMKSAAFRKLESQKKEVRLPFFPRMGRIVRALCRLTPRRLALYRAAIYQRVLFQTFYENDRLDES